LTAISKAQLEALRARPEIVSLYANRTFKPLTNVSRAFIGARDLMSDREVMLRNGGAPVSGRGIGIAYVDTGIDATHPDLQFGANVVQNVLFPLAELPLEFLSDFVWSP
jgi:serine protease AprX